MKWNIIKGIGLSLLILSLVGFMCYAGFSAIDTAEKGHKICENTAIQNQNSTYNPENYYTLDGYCCYTNNFREEYCQRISWDE